VAGAAAASAGVTNSINEGEISGAQWTAGIIAKADNSVAATECQNTAPVSGNGMVAGILGGITGYSSSKSYNIDGCVNYGSVSGTGDNVAGISGYFSGQVQNCANYADVEGANYVSGVVGQMMFSWNVSGCLNEGAISGAGRVAGICGYGTVSLASDANRGSVSGSGSYVAGISGYSGQIEDCCNTGAVAGLNFVAGIAGFAQSLDSCYNAGSVTALQTGSASAGSVAANSSGWTNCHYLEGTASSSIGAPATSAELAALAPDLGEA
jgi:hypothetical protein